MQISADPPLPLPNFGHFYFGQIQIGLLVHGNYVLNVHMSTQYN